MAGLQGTAGSFAASLPALLFGVNNNLIIHEGEIKDIIMKKGTVKFFNHSKGFGFITVEGTGEEIFVHISDVSGEIRDNDKVEFDIQNGRKGLNAVNVRVI